MHNEKNKNLIKKNEDCKETFGLIEKKELKTTTIQKMMKIRTYLLKKYLYFFFINKNIKKLKDTKDRKKSLPNEPKEPANGMHIIKKVE